MRRAIRSGPASPEPFPRVSFLVEEPSQEPKRKWLDRGTKFGPPKRIAELELRSAGRSSMSIANALGRTRKAVDGRIALLRARARPEASENFKGRET